MPPIDHFEDIRHLISEAVEAALLVEDGCMPDDISEKVIEIERRLALALGVDLDATT